MENQNGSKSKGLKVLFVAAEMYPFASVGGLGMAVSSLAQEMKKKGVDVRVFVPKYGLIDETKNSMKVIVSGLKVPTDDEKQEIKNLVCNVKEGSFGNLKIPVYFLENMEYFEKRSNVYGYSDDPLRFILLSRGALEFLRQSDWVPDVINCADWHTGALPNYLKTVYAEDLKISKIKTVFSIHNLYHQGTFDHKFVSEIDFDDGRSPVASFFSERLTKQNFLKRGIIYSDTINTVSETYAQEILTPDYGEKLDGLLKEVRTKLHGILNGLDYAELNPETDKNISANYSYSTLKKRAQNKEVLQKEFNLEVLPDAPILGMVGRLDEQKGIDLLFPILDILVSEYGCQFVAVGGGDDKYRSFFEEIQKKYPAKIGCHLMAEFSLARHIFSGCDIFLVPSKYEPCGITQMEAMRYGAVPVVRKTGGLADTVEDFNLAENSGSGFVFEKFNPFAFFGAVVRALETYKNKEAWEKLTKRIMKIDFSWEISAEKYIELYQKVLS